MTASVLLGVAAAGGLVMAESDSWRPIAAAGGGAILSLSCHWNQLPFPKWLIPTDAGAAVLGFVLLVPATWTARLAGEGEQSEAAGLERPLWFAVESWFGSAAPVPSVPEQSLARGSAERRSGSGS